ncbi:MULTISPECIES: ParA family protein [unclassified Roseofilum]|uniref:ParA family protein n=1 Tax=unclassified Roseofilum TaxID=2620099 RepID=UPI001B2A3D86|nr:MULTISPECIES: ParA family protein [unclassified Roseofilum]MBP0011283.1 ParA family protein [Roseofilum sp. Belize Diploria]MBP0014586.1 ParA family protein [Roseofilum sp. SID3]MBP0026061.1 ParA family protein [Roseofilum sp. SID2]MBP0033968.1 ParA family protein [Roseofilum sp. Belize BBD 4]MBP0038282.1 ParA family protein [Roseofilum sp. SID1]
MGYIISTVNMKGGVGKTTLTVNLAACLAKYHDKRVLIVDLDAQISATLSMMSPSDFAKLRRDQRTLRELVKKAINPAASSTFPIQDIIIPYACNVPKLHLLPGDIDMYDEFSVSEMIYEKAVYREQVSFETVWNRFERVLVESILKPIIDEYDYIILDCAPGYNLLTRSALTASDFYLLPARPEPLSLIGIQLLERRLAKLREVHQDGHPLDIQMLGIVFTMAGGFIGRYYRQVMNRVRTDYSEAKLFKTRIPADINVSKAVDNYLPVVIAHPHSRGSKAFQKLTEELLDKLHTTISRKQQQSSVKMSDL